MLLHVLQGWQRRNSSRGSLTLCPNLFCRFHSTVLDHYRDTEKVATTARRSVRIAARTWPRGDTQAKARQVLMKRLGILDNEGLSPDD